MRRRHYHSTGGKGTAVGVDIGATLAKLAVRDGDARLRFDLLPARPVEAVARAVLDARPIRVGLTGGGSAALARLLSLDTAPVLEFDALGAGAAALLGERAGSRYLVVSVGTGTSIILFDAGRVHRLGGTPLGGGTLLGLGSALAGTSDYAELCALAARGRRAAVDLTVADIYAGQDAMPLPPELTAASFARLARPGEPPPRREDLARALVAMVGENVALIAGGIAAAAGVQQVVVAGSPLRGNPVLEEVLADILGRFGRPPIFLEQGEFGGALGALLHVQPAPQGRPTRSEA